ncbi:unnamed protein product [Rotaria magnacalcarata]
MWRTGQLMWKSVLGTNFIRQYCLPDKMIHLKYFHFYIGRRYELSLVDIENTINSFKNDTFFILHQWTNIKFLYDKNESYQHIFSNFNKSQLTQPFIYDWSDTRHISIDFDSSLYLFFDQLNELCSNVASITIYIKHYINESNTMTTLFKMGEKTLNYIQLCNVTTLRFGIYRGRTVFSCDTLTDQDKERAKTFAHLLSMPVQLKYLFMQRFEWLLYVTQYAADELRKNALSTIRYAEFGIPSCNLGKNESIHSGKHLVPILRTYMPHLHVLQLWRPDDFPWTSLRPNYKSRQLYGPFLARWMRSLSTLESINDHVSVFEQDLSQLVDQLKEFIFLDIRGVISCEKVESYRLMVQTRFPNSRIDVHRSRFRLWL